VFEEHQGGATTPKVPDNPLQVRPSTCRVNKTDGATTAESIQVQLGWQMRGNLQATEGFSNISIDHTKAETRPLHPGIFGGLGRGNQCCVGVGGRRQGTTDILR